MFEFKNKYFILSSVNTGLLLLHFKIKLIHFFYLKSSNSNSIYKIKKIDKNCIIFKQSDNI